MTARGLKTLVLAAALAVMPLQGVAATLSFLLCHGEAQAHAAHAGDSHHHGANAGDHAHEPAGDAPQGNPLYHLCCHFTVTAPADMTLAVAPLDFPLLAAAPERQYDLFVPDRPQRPPLA